MNQNWRSTGSVSVLGMGVALPGPPLTLDCLLQRIETRFPGLPRARLEALSRRLEITSRHVARPFEARVERAAPGLSNPALAAAALSAALGDAGLTPAELGFVLGHTATPAQPLPSNIALAADVLGYSGPALELRQACTGFAAALSIAFGLLAHPDAAPVAIVGSETGSLFFDPQADLDSQLVGLAMMGDGAAAIVLGPAQPGAAAIDAAWFGSIGLGRAPGLAFLHGGADFPAAPGDGPITAMHDHRAVLESGEALFRAALAGAAEHGIEAVREDWIIPHQASGRIGHQLAPFLGVSPERVFVNANRVGNTGSAAMWLALAELRQRLAPGETALALGAEATKYMHGGFRYTHAAAVTGRPGGPNGSG
jgi:3-oxoacyl-[acyl-carrier-protein] synthase-3